MIKTVHDLDRALNKEKVTFGEKQSFESHSDVYQFVSTHELLDISTKLKIDVHGHQILSELYKQGNKLYELETLYDTNDVFLYAVATVIIEKI